MKKIICLSMVIVLVLGFSISSFAFEGFSSNLNVVLNRVEVMVNGTSTFNDDDVHTILYNGTTYIPLRKVSENLGCKVEYNQDTQQANIKGVRSQILAECVDVYDTGITKGYIFMVNGQRYSFFTEEGDFTVGDLYGTFNNGNGIIDNVNQSWKLTKDGKK